MKSWPTSLAVVALITAGGCQGGWSRFVPESIARINPLSDDRPPAVVNVQPKVPDPVITDKNYAQIQLVLGDSLAKEGKFEAAQAAYEAALRNDDSLARGNHRLALVREKIGNGRDAKPLFLRAMKLDPKNAEIVCDYGYWCYLRRDFEEARNQFHRALELDPELKRAHNNLGLVYARTNRPQEALQQFAMSGLSSAEARTNLGLVYATERRLPEARMELERAVGENPGLDKAQQALTILSKPDAQAVVQSASPQPQLESSDPAAPIVEAASNQPVESMAPVESGGQVIPMAERPSDEAVRIAAKTPLSPSLAPVSEPVASHPRLPMLELEGEPAAPTAGTQNLSAAELAFSRLPAQTGEHSADQQPAPIVQNPSSQSPGPNSASMASAEKLAVESSYPSTGVPGWSPSGLVNRSNWGAPGSDPAAPDDYQSRARRAFQLWPRQRQ